MRQVYLLNIVFVVYLVLLTNIKKGYNSLLATPGIQCEE